MKNYLFALSLAVFAVLSLLPNACKHEPDMVPTDPNPHDTTTVPIDTNVVTGYPCSPDTVYFQNQILPLLISQCAQAGCHNAASHKEGVYITDYTKIMQNIKAFNPAGSKIYTSIVTTSSDNRMPPAPAAAWTTAQVDLLKKWINQGALNNGCNENYGGCDTTGITYTNTIKTLMDNKCIGCHYPNSTTGGGFDLSTYEKVKAVAVSGDLYGDIAFQPGYNKMPKGGAKLSTCTIQQVNAWIHQGMPK
jgi:hypothetical protein